MAKNTPKKAVVAPVAAQDGGPSAKNRVQDEGDEEDDYDEEADEDYDPSKKQADENEPDSDTDTEQPDYSKLEASTSVVRTRNQRYHEKYAPKAVPGFERDATGLLRDTSSNIDVHSIFSELRDKSTSGVTEDWKAMVASAKESAKKEPVPVSLEPQKVRIESSYTFAGRLITETKLVDANSAEAQAYLNSTSKLTAEAKDASKTRSYVAVVREIKGTGETAELRIKLKRPSLVDKFLTAYGGKRQKLSTLEKSRLDWASFVDSKKLKDDLTTHNKGGYLEKQAFLGRMDAKRDEQYQHAKEMDRKQREN